ncbi:MAG: hypothetical protein WCP95_04780 [Actinomycetes bacterium]
MSAFPACSRSAKPSKEAVDFIAAALAADRVRLIALETRNPHGGRGGSLDSDQCAWLVRELAGDRQRGVVITTRHRSRELLNDRIQIGATPRICADELVSLLLAYPNVLGWIAGNRHRPGAIRHGGRDLGLWEMTPSLLGFGGAAWLGHQDRHGVRFVGQSVAAPAALAMTSA